MKKLIITAAALAAVAAIPAHAAQIYNAASGLVGNQPWQGTLGLDFDVTAPVLVNQLGVFDSGGDGLLSTLFVTIFDRATQSALFTPVEFAAGTPGTGAAYIFKSIGGFLLAPGQYQLAAYGYNNAENNYNNSGPGGPITFDNLSNHLTAIGTSFSTNAGTYGNIPDVGTTRYGAGSFIATAVPEPSTWSLLMVGFGLLGGALRRRKQTVRVSFA